ncbi:MAG: glycoside hydrolase [Pseudonocardiales bacterium]|nr:glycoside hydrolase [Pseudonocardiales bacterium]
MATLTAVVLVPGNAPADGRGTQSSCGGERISSGYGYRTCTFDDEFSNSTLDYRKWQTVETAKTGFHSGDECYVNDATHVSVGSGVLTLRATRSAPTNCTVISTPYQSGMIQSYGLFSQRYGRFEIRAKFPAGQGLQPALWMMPQNSVYGSWPNSGEIDIAEAWGNYPGIVSPHLHFQPATTLATMLGMGVSGAPGNYCSVPSSASAFHTYAVDWSPTSFQFIYDGATCWQTSSWQAAGLTQPAPFDQRFYLILELALGNAATPGNQPDATSQFPAELQVDYVRAWQ